MPNKTTFRIIGRGRVGLSLAALLPQIGYQETPELREPEILFITTPDTAISKTAELCAETLRPTVALHCSGAHGSELLDPLARIGVAIGSLHPLRSFNTKLTKLEQLSGVYWCIEGEPKAVAVATEIVHKLSGQIIEISQGSKPLYHAAAVTACGHLVALLDMSVEMLMECGLERSKALQVLLPLVNSTIENLNNWGIERSLTGPFARKDYETVITHLRALTSAKGDYLSVYTALGRRSLAIKSRGI
ncbi:MAG: DUF2520 domain-containing protein [Acidobacteriota bacterium]|nr:DUF2520 domain-containing protein [Blastocatellia bacterium]MDW8411723.1 DUF2520 domain-containing protein [Acidobacteriota bacterium]